MKLVSGETIVAVLEDVTENDYIVINPMQMEMTVNSYNRPAIIAQEWVVSQTNIFKISKSHVIVSSVPSEMMQGYYASSLMKLTNSENKVMKESEFDDYEEIEDEYDEFIDEMKKIEPEKTFH
jgi:hypothetical protein